MTEAQRTALSKFLSLVLRHQPELVGVKLDAQGWVSVEELLQRCRERGRGMSRQMLEEVVATSPKQRFALSPDGLRIRAQQGHSVEVELGYAAAIPPEFLYHGTTASALPGILLDGIQKMNRHHVHLSAEIEAAKLVGARRGKAILLRVEALRMHCDGFEFFLADNGVWLTDHVPLSYFEI